MQAFAQHAGIRSLHTLNCSLPPFADVFSSIVRQSAGRDKSWCALVEWVCRQVTACRSSSFQSWSSSWAAAFCMGAPSIDAVFVFLHS